jgi:hypothetical protein
MINKFTAKQKFIAMLVAFVILLYLAVFKSFNPTFIQYQNLLENKIKISRVEGIQDSISFNQNKLNELNFFVGEVNVEFDRFQSVLLEELLRITAKYNVNVKSIDEPNYYITNGFEVQSMVLDLQGNFKNILKSIQALEKSKSTGRLISTSFQLIEDKQNKKVFLETKIYVQNYKRLN